MGQCMSVIGDDNNTLDSSNHSNISLEDYSQLRMRKSVPYKTKQQEEDDRRELLKIEAAVQKNLREGALPLLMRHETHDEEDHEEGEREAKAGQGGTGARMHCRRAPSNPFDLYSLLLLALETACRRAMFLPRCTMLTLSRDRRWTSGTPSRDVPTKHQMDQRAKQVATAASTLRSSMTASCHLKRTRILWPESIREV